MLNLILGTAGSGKTYKIRELIRQKINGGDKKIILLVPEQNSFQNERELIRLLGADNTSNVEVMSFTRLTDLVFRKVGGLSGRRLNDGCRNVLMSLALNDINDNLTLYKELSSSSNMVEIMISALKEFKMCRIGLEDISDMSKKVKDNMLKKKLEETVLILKTYDALISQGYIDPLDDLSWLEGKVSETDFFNDYIVFIDGFNGFTIQEIKVVEHIIKQSKESYISFCSDKMGTKEDGLSLFSPVYSSINRVIRFAKENNIKINSPIMLYKQMRFKNDILKVIESSMYRSKRELCELENSDNVIIYSAANVYEEVEFVANRIKKMVFEQGYQYRDFAIIARMSDTYRGVIDVAFENNFIPYFMDKPQQITSKPLIKFVISAFEIIHNSYSSEYIFQYLKTGLTDLTVEEISILENYVFMWNISGRKWLDEFGSHPDGFSKEFTDDDIELLNRINTIRRRVITPLKKFEDKIKNGTGEHYSREIFFLLEDVDVYSNIVKIYESLKKTINPIIAQEQIRIWDLLISILEQMALVLKKRYLTSKRYVELLKMMICSNDISFIPQGIDQVIIGDADRIRLDSPKAVFIIGAVEGEFPRTPVPFGIFNDLERKNLISLGLPMYNSLEKLVIDERFLAYCSMSSASHNLFVSWPASDIKGQSKLPSSIVRGIRKIIPSIPIYDDLSINASLLDKIWSEKTAFDMCSRYYKEDSVFANTLKHYFMEHEQYKNKIKSIERVISKEPIEFNDSFYAKELFGENMSLSASQVENFYLCKFQYFCKYGLKAKERKVAEFDSLEYGTVVHYILENIFNTYDKQEICSLKREQIKTEVRKLLNEYLNSRLGGIDDKSTRFRYLYFRLIKSLELLILHMINEMMQSEFTPTDFEISIGDDIDPMLLSLPDGATIRIKGKVDRLDTMQKNGKTYIRVIDYKTGAKEFRLSDVLYGLNMQMLIYLASICKNGKKRYGENIVPAGVLYMPSAKNVLEVYNNMSADEINKDKEKCFKMSGLILDDPMVIHGMEEKAQGIFIPVSLKNGKASKSEYIASISQLGTILKYIEKLIICMAEQLRSGDVSMEPTFDQYEFCKWCSYKSICGNEAKDHMKIIKKIKKDDVLIEMEADSVEKETVD